MRHSICAVHRCALEGFKGGDLTSPSSRLVVPFLESFENIVLAGPFCFPLEERQSCAHRHCCSIVSVLRSGSAMSDVAFVSVPALIESYYGELRSYASRKLGNAAAAEDVVQEACLRFASARDEPIENPRAWLYRVVGNLVIDQLRRERSIGNIVHQGPDHLDVVDETIDLERQLVAKQRLATLAKAVAELPPRCRECFVMRRFDDLDQNEIAERMGISRNMVEKHLRQALIHCTSRLREAD
ncbi:RNA polymerase sigma factor [Xanthobacteraceae bacterium A53D]